MASDVLLYHQAKKKKWVSLIGSCLYRICNTGQQPAMAVPRKEHPRKRIIFTLGSPEREMKGLGFFFLPVPCARRTLWCLNFSKT
ncbi:Uncharacterized protein TCM_020666 [Theobroma cacao]|uniref:Uncharacterized protein n=1 Tax=Theobroma cacao TaxID=3641 RepID=A0A061ETY6_THECC|nr:Uncharacterized protein TCM_020666 [Theobroma cacao]